MRALVALGLVVLASLTAARLPAWRDDVTLLSSAAVHTRTWGRPSLNLGIALIRRGEHEAGAARLLRAAMLAERRQSPRDAELLAMAKRGFLWLEAFGTPVCSRPAYQRYC